MSNRRCDVCGVEGDWRFTDGLCTKHSEQKAEAAWRLKREEDAEFSGFMELPDEEKWRQMWDAMRGSKE